MYKVNLVRNSTLLTELTRHDHKLNVKHQNTNVLEDNIRKNLDVLMISNGY